MIKQFILTLVGVLATSGCTSTKNTVEYANLALTDNELAQPKWADLKRFPARYPEQAVINSLEGCATVQYVITPDNEIKDVAVVESTNRNFSVAAKDVITNWKWKDLPNNIISDPVKTQTRFDFCLDKANQNCSVIEPKCSCPGEDIIHSRGMMLQ